VRGVVARDPAWNSVKKGMIRHLLEFYVVLALFLLSFNLVPCHSDVLHRTLHLHTYGIPTLYHAATLSHCT
jgi:hypothetical protein